MERCPLRRVTTALRRSSRGPGVAPCLYRPLRRSENGLADERMGTKACALAHDSSSLKSVGPSSLAKPSISISWKDVIRLESSNTRSRSPGRSSSQPSVNLKIYSLLPPKSVISPPRRVQPATLPISAAPHARCNSREVDVREEGAWVAKGPSRAYPFASRSCRDSVEAIFKPWRSGCDKCGCCKV